MKRWLIICSSISGSLLLIGCFDLGHWGAYYAGDAKVRGIVLVPGEIRFLHSAPGDPFGLDGFSWGSSKVDPFAPPHGDPCANLFSEITFSVGNLARMPRLNPTYLSIPFWLISLMVFSVLYIPVYLRRRRRAAENVDTESKP